MNLNVVREFDLAKAPQRLAQDFFLDLDLVLVAAVLVVASATAGEIPASSRDAMRGGLDHTIGMSPSEAGLLFGKGRLDFFSGQDEWNEHRLTAPARVGREAREAVAAIDQLFDCEEQDLILGYGRRARRFGR